MSVEVKGELKQGNAKVEVTKKSQDDQALEVVNRNTLWAMGLGLLPLPGVDLIALTAIQVKMISELSDSYRVPFSEHRAKSILGSLVSGLGALAVAPVLFSLVKIVPIVGQTAGVVSLPLSAGAFTYAVGRLFVQHFASGGTLLDFDPGAMRNHFRREYESAQQTVRDIKAPEIIIP